ncbi:flagellar basal body L-ring protein FlgH [Aminomonas paucivorans]|uniref:flagellar basal body L-ring protein FlgH n=1 Tax=Aminomonas paucivorans TaxID=81412 RepID=UPI003317A1F4
MSCRSAGEGLLLRGLLFLMVLACGWGLPLQPCGAESLWQEDANLFTDRKPSKVGDIVTVLVQETTDTKDEGKTTAKKTDKSGVEDWTGVFDFLRGFVIGAASDTTGDGKSERKHHIKTSIGCVVTEITPGGNLVLLGTRDLMTQAEKMQVSFTGVVRPEDIGPNNTVSSNRVANAEIRVEGKGSISRLQKPGIFTQILQSIF